MLDNLKKYNIILASGSPRRKELLEGLGVDFRVEVVNGIEETYPHDLPVAEIPVYLSRLKAHAYQANANDLIITADTVVILDGKVIGKPHDEAEAKRMLSELSGNVHTVVTGVTGWNRLVAVRKWSLHHSPMRKSTITLRIIVRWIKRARMAFRNGLAIWASKALRVVSTM